MTLTDTIERTLHLNASQDKVWTAISTVEGICSWFCDRIEGDWRPSEPVTLVWGDSRARARVGEIQPQTLVTYQWVPGETKEDLPWNEDNLTTVEFQLEPVPTASRLTVIERGFSKLPQEHWERCLKDNSEGWTSELAKLENLFP